MPSAPFGSSACHLCAAFEVLYSLGLCDGGLYLFRLLIQLFKRHLSPGSPFSVLLPLVSESPVLRW